MTTTRPEMKRALAAIGVTDTTLSPTERDFLDENGYLVLPDVLTATELELMRAKLSKLLVLEKALAGSEDAQIGVEKGAVRIGNLPTRDDVFKLAFTRPRVVAAVGRILENDMRVSNGVHTRFVLPGQGAQNLHRDYQKPAQGGFVGAQTIWLLDDFTPENGPTRVVPRSHQFEGDYRFEIPSDVLADTSAPHPDEKILTGRAGTVIVACSHIWHSGTLNRTALPRRALHADWVRRAYREAKDLREAFPLETHTRFSKVERYLLGLDDTLELPEPMRAR